MKKIGQLYRRKNPKPKGGAKLSMRKTHIYIYSFFLFIYFTKMTYKKIRKKIVQSCRMKFFILNSLKYNFLHAHDFCTISARFVQNAQKSVFFQKNKKVQPFVQK